MTRSTNVHVLYSFPHKLGAGRICDTAWHLMNALVAQGAEVRAMPGAVHRPVAAAVSVRPTLARGKWRIPYKAIGRLQAFALHDRIVARRLKELAGQIDVVHTWPLGAWETLKAAARLGIPTVLERPNAHTRFAYRAVREECERLGMKLPATHEHAYNEKILAIEEEEYRLADYLLCPSDFVKRTFLDEGFPEAKLLRHQYGYDDTIFYPSKERQPQKGLTVLFVGGCAPRKGLHYALEAWLRSPACVDGTFRIAGAFVSGYAEKMAELLRHPSVHVLGHRSDIPELMRESDVLTLPSIEEGSALVTSEARGSGCVLLVSEAAGAVCEHMENALVHRVGDVEALTRHITMLHEDRALLAKLRAESLRTATALTWAAAGARLLEVYRQAIAGGCERVQEAVGVAGA